MEGFHNLRSLTDSTCAGLRYPIYKNGKNIKKTLKRKLFNKSYKITKLLE
ncbi:hypothetical protein LguiB_005442 [Lonicera macranthoides]